MESASRFLFIIFLLTGGALLLWTVSSNALNALPGTKGVLDFRKGLVRRYLYGGLLFATLASIFSASLFAQYPLAASPDKRFYFGGLVLATACVLGVSVWAIWRNVILGLAARGLRFRILAFFAWMALLLSYVYFLSRLQGWSW